MAKALLYDATVCIGCLECERGCAKQNNLPYTDTIEKQKKTSEFKYTYVGVKNVKGEDKYLRRLCMHCNEPTCVSACPVGALNKTKLGPVTYNEDKCMGCRYCMIACPYGIPKYEWSKVLPRVQKCVLCSDRVEKGLQTACADACPVAATIFGDRDDLVREAHKRIQEKPNDYINHVYGETEAGGGSVLMLSSIPFEQFGLPNASKIGSQPVPYLTADIIEHIPSVVAVGWAALGGVWWITSRREAVAAAERKEKQQ